MKKHWRRGRFLRRCALTVCLCVWLTGCSYDTDVIMTGGSAENTEAKKEAESVDMGFRIMEPGEYDSKDTAVVVRVLEDENKITFLNRIVNKNYTLTYDGTTTIADRYGGSLSAAQLAPGDIVDVCFQHIPKKCVSVTRSASAWEADVINGFTMNQARGQISFNGELYTLAERMVLRSGGEEIELTDLNERDVLSVKGIENTIYSIVVEKGHGYLRLTGTEYFVDGFIEVGKEMVQRITEDMMLTVPEGEYTVVVRNGSHGGSKQAKIYRDEETVLDLSDLKGEEVKSGNVFFTLTPADASVYIDGEKIDTSAYVTLEYGVHQMIVKAAGYETISQYIKIGQENANLNVEMEPEGSGAEEGGQDEDPGDGEQGDVNAAGTGTAADGNIAAGGQSGDTAAGGAAESSTAAGQTAGAASEDMVTAGSGTWHVRVTAPKDAEVYVDGNYIGLAPVSFPKKAGSHVISLRKNGYQTRSYTIQVDSEEKDMELSFSELVKKTDYGLGTTGLGLDTTGLGDGTWTNDILSKTLWRS